MGQRANPPGRRSEGKKGLAASPPAARRSNRRERRKRRKRSRQGGSASALRFRPQPRERPWGRVQPLPDPRADAHRPILANPSAPFAGASPENGLRDEYRFGKRRERRTRRGHRQMASQRASPNPNAASREMRRNPETPSRSAETAPHPRQRAYKEKEATWTPKTWKCSLDE